MCKKLFCFIFVILLTLSMQEHGFSVGHSTLPGNEDEQKDHVRYPLIAKPEEINPAAERLAKQFGSNVNAAAYLAENVVSPWISSLSAERYLLLTLLDSDECSKNFLKHYHLIRDAATRFSTLASPGSPPSVKTFTECIQAFSLPDKKKQYAIRESLIYTFVYLIEAHGWGEAISNYFLGYAHQGGSIYAEYEIALRKTNLMIGQHGFCSADTLQKKRGAKLNYKSYYKHIENLIQKLPQMGAKSIFDLAAVIGLILEEDAKKNISYIKEAIDRHYNSIERYRANGEMKEFMNTSNDYNSKLAIGYTMLAKKENESKEKQKKYFHKALEIWKNIYDDQCQEEDLNFMGWRSSFYQEIGNHGKAQDLFSKWAAKKTNQLKEAQAALAEKRAIRATLIKEDLQSKKRQERELSPKPAPKQGHAPRLVTQARQTIETDRCSSPTSSLSVERREEKIKIKTKGVADLSQARRQPQGAVEQVEEARPDQMRIEELLKEGSKYYQRFCEFFSMYEEGTRGIKAISISMAHAKKLLDRIHSTLDDQLGLKSQTKAVDSSKGKGSHAKAEVSNGIEKVVLTLSKKQTLLPYQIQHLVDAFVRLGYYPQYLEDTLKQKGILTPPQVLAYP